MIPAPTALRLIRRGCTHKDLRTLGVRAVKAGVRVKKIKSGVVFATEQGTACLHFTGSDVKAVRALTAQLRQIGVAI